jgi:hypothetical protein
MIAILMTQEPGARGDEVAAANAERLGLEVGLEDLVTEPTRIHECTPHRCCEDDASHFQRRAIGGGSLDDAWRGSRGIGLFRRLVRHVIHVRVHGIVLWPATILAKPTRLAAWPIARSRRSGRAIHSQGWGLLFGGEGEVPERCDLVPDAERVSVILEPNSDLLDNSFAPIDVDLGSRMVRFTGVMSTEDAIARVEQHLRGRRHDHAPLLPTQNGVL